MSRFVGPGALGRDLKRQRAQQIIVRIYPRNSPQTKYIVSVASGEAVVLEADTNKVVASFDARHFGESYRSRAQKKADDLNRGHRP